MQPLSSSAKRSADAEKIYVAPAEKKELTVGHFASDNASCLKCQTLGFEKLSIFAGSCCTIARRPGAEKSRVEVRQAVACLSELKQAVACLQRRHFGCKLAYCLLLLQMVSDTHTGSACDVHTLKYC